MKELEKHLAIYQTAYPEAENPENYLMKLGEVGLLEILKEANGREIIFGYGEELERGQLDAPLKISYR